MPTRNLNQLLVADISSTQNKNILALKPPILCRSWMLHRLRRLNFDSAQIGFMFSFLAATSGIAFRSSAMLPMVSHQNATGKDDRYLYQSEGNRTGVVVFHSSGLLYSRRVTGTGASSLAAVVNSPPPQWPWA